MEIAVVIIQGCAVIGVSVLVGVAVFTGPTRAATRWSPPPTAADGTGLR